jgi:hypothetical protein
VGVVDLQIHIDKEGPYKNIHILFGDSAAGGFKNIFNVNLKHIINCVKYKFDAVYNMK